jgi:hypothetical protein
MTAETDHEVFNANVRELLSKSFGKEVIWHILSMCNIYGDTFTGNSHTYYLEGKRAVGLEILQMLEDADPTAYPKLLLSQQKLNED